MPTVPDIVPSQPASVGGTPEVNVPAPVEAFGGAIGHALSGLGSTFEHSGDEIWQRAMQLQDLQNRTKVDQADSDFMDQATKMHAEFITKRGENASAEQLNQFGNDLRTTRERIRDGLENSMQQKLYDTQSRSSMWRTMFSAASHSGQQVQAARIDSLKSRQVSLHAMAANSSDPNTQQWARGQISRGIDEQHAILGTPESAAEDKQSTFSELNADIFIHNAKGDPVGSFDELQAMHSRGEIVGPAYDRAYNNILPRRNSMVADNTANDVWNSGIQDKQQTKSLGDMEKEVRTKMKAVAPDDALIAQQSVNRLHTLYNQEKSALAVETNQNKQTVYGAINTGQVTSVRDIQNNPATSKAYDDLPETVKAGLPATINNRNRQANEYESGQLYTRLLGMATNRDPDVKAEFMDVDILSLPLLQGAKDKLILRRANMLKGQDDTRVDRAMNWLRHSPQATPLAELQLNKRSGNEAEYDSFQGALHTALEDWQDTKKSPATQEDVLTKIGPALMAGRVSEHWYRRDVHEYNIPPEWFVTQMQKEATDRNLPAKSDGELQRLYIHAQLNKFYPPSKKSDAAK